MARRSFTRPAVTDARRPPTVDPEEWHCREQAGLERLAGRWKSMPPRGRLPASASAAKQSPAWGLERVMTSRREPCRDSLAALGVEDHRDQVRVLARAQPEPGRVKVRIPSLDGEMVRHAQQRPGGGGVAELRAAGPLVLVTADPVAAKPPKRPAKPRPHREQRPHRNWDRYCGGCGKDIARDGYPAAS